MTAPPDRDGPNDPGGAGEATPVGEAGASEGAYEGEHLPRFPIVGIGASAGGLEALGTSESVGDVPDLR